MFARPPPPPPPYVHVRNLDGIGIFVDTTSGMPLWVLPSSVNIQRDIQYICILNDDRTHYFKDFSTNTISHDLPEQDMSGNARSVCYALLAYNNEQCSSFMENPFDAIASKTQDEILNNLIEKLNNTNKDDSNIGDDDNDDDDDDDNVRSTINNRDSNIYLRQSEVGNEIFMEGNLMKLARSSERNWKKRYFVLSRISMTYYNKGRPLGKALGDLLITGDTTLNANDEEELQGYSFRISNQYGTMKMAANSKADASLWIEKIQALIEMNKVMCCDYLHKRTYRLGFTSNIKKFFVLTDDKVTVHPSAEKVSYVEAMVKIEHSAQVTYDDKNFRMTFIETNPNSKNKNELTIQFPDSGLEFGSWRSFILKNITINDVNDTKSELTPPPPPPSTKGVATQSMKKGTVISPIQKLPGTPNDDFESFDTDALSANKNISGLNALEAAKARREARNSETKQPSKPFMSKLTSAIPFYNANQSVKSAPTTKESDRPNIFGLNSMDDEADDIDKNIDSKNDIIVNDTVKADDNSMEIENNLSGNDDDDKSRNTADRPSLVRDSSSRSARKMFEKKSVSFDKESAAVKSKYGGDYEVKSYPEEKSIGDNTNTYNGIRNNKVATHAIKLADLNTSSPQTSTPALSISVSSPTSSASSSPLPPPSSPYLTLLQTDIIDINPNANLMRSFGYANNTSKQINTTRENVTENVTENVNLTYNRSSKTENYNNTSPNPYSSFSPKGEQQASMHSIENFVASVSSSREEIVRQFHNNIQRINVFVKEPKESRDLKTKVQRDSKYCQTDQRIYMDEIHRRPYEILVAEKEELVIAREKLALDVTTALAHIKKEEEASLKKIKDLETQLNLKYENLSKDLDMKKIKQEEEHREQVESFQLTRKAADHLHKKRLTELQVVAKAISKHHDKIIKERQLIAVQRFQLYLALQDLNNQSMSRSIQSTSKFPILKDEVHRVYTQRPLSPTQKAEALLVSYGTKAKNVNVKNKVLSRVKQQKSKAIGRSFVYGGQQGFVPDLNV